MSLTSECDDRTGTFAIAEFMALIAGGIDVSFPALASLSAYATTKFLLDKNYEGNVLLAFVIAIAIGAVLGAFNGYFIGYLNLNAMIVTLGSASIFQGIMQGTLRANQLSVIPPGMKSFGTAAFLTATNKANGLTSILPYTFIILVLVCAVYAFCTALYVSWTWYLRNRRKSTECTHSWI